MQPVFGFREHAHTADWELEVWAPDLPSLLEQAARGMYALSGVRLQAGMRLTRTIDLQTMDAEGLLVRFLSDLLWLEQEEGLGFDTFNLHLEGEQTLHAELGGTAIVDLAKEIKAVTYHNLAVQHTPEGLRVNIVFDV
jgi:SHS2 domain-containing protein